MFGIRLTLGVAVATSLVLGAVPAAFGQEAPPRFVDVYLSPTPCTFLPGDETWEFGTDDCPLEDEVLYICMEIEDLDWADAQGGDDQGVVITMFSEWRPYVRSAIAYGPQPPPVPTDRLGEFAESEDILDYYFFPPPADDITLYAQLVFWVPEFNGANQARLRGLIDYDVLWDVNLTARNGGADSPPDENAPRDVVDFFVCGLQDPNLVPGNPPPFADAGPDQTVQAGDTAILDGSLSFDRSNVGFSPFDPEVFDKDALEYAWEWISGPERVDPEPDPDEPAGSPIALVTLDVEGTYVYRLLVEDGVNTPPSTDEVTIYAVETLAENRAPSAVITGPTSAVNVGSTIELSAADSSDPDGDTLTYRWRQTNEIGGPLDADEVVLQFQPISGVTSKTASWRATAAGTYYFSLLVTDPSGLSDTDSITVEVADAGGTNMSGRASGAGDGSDQWGAGGGAPGAPACGAGALPVAVVPVLLLLGRSRGR